MTNTDRQHLARILGMLGSAYAGERAAAGLQAESFRRKHGLTWEEMINGKTIYVGGNPPWHTPPPAPPEPPVWTPPPRITLVEVVRTVMGYAALTTPVIILVFLGWLAADHGAPAPAPAYYRVVVTEPGASPRTIYVDTTGKEITSPH